jgi:hypothetical protein
MRPLEPWFLCTAALMIACNSPQTSKLEAKRDTQAVSEPASSRAIQSTKATWIGQSFSKLPDTVSLYSDDTLMQHDTVYATWHVESRGRQVLWLTIGAGKGDRGAASWTILAEMDVAPREGERVFFSSCRLDKRPDRRVIALGEYEDLPSLTHMRLAWKPNPALRRFDQIPPAGIDCKNANSGE